MELKNTEHAESVKERIDLLFEELSFAIQWQRPSIMLVFYESENLQGTAELVLEKRLAGIGQQVARFTVNERHFDIPLLLSKRPDRNRIVYSVTGLSAGGGSDGANAYRALNMRREYFVDFAIRVIIWLAKDEAIALSRHAPDFWAFRHRVVEFNESSDLEFLKTADNDLSGKTGNSPDRLQDLDDKIELCEELIGRLTRHAASYSRKLDLLSTLASLYQARKAYEQSIHCLKRAIAIAKKLNNIERLAEFWGNLGTNYLELDQPNRAIRAYWKAIRFNPQDAGLWMCLGQIYLKQGRAESVRSVLKKASQVKPLDKNA